LLAANVIAGAASANATANTINRRFMLSPSIEIDLSRSIIGAG